MTDASASMTLRVQEARSLNPLIRLFRLQGGEGEILPPFTPGSHIKVKVALPGGQTDWRHYSLIELTGAAGMADAPTVYTIAVRLEEGGRGGSKFMHEQLQAGDSIEILPPKNDFPLHDGDPEAVLIAGGIGITPMASMAALRSARGQPVRMCYAGRNRSLMAFLPELETLLGDRLDVHADDERGQPLDIGAILDGCSHGERVYVCGPKVMLDAVLAASEARGWPRERVHFELFTEPVVEEGDQPFEVVLASSGKTFMVPPGKTIVDCMIDNGEDPMFDCKRGECGVCATPVLEGEIDHRDYVLSQGEKDAGNVIQICISRAKGKRLVLDI